MNSHAKGHLPEEAMLHWQMGDASQAEQAHVAGCSECQTQTKPLADALSWFGAAARQWGEERAAVPRQRQTVSPAPRHRWRIATAGLAALCAILLLMIGIAIPYWRASRAATAAKAHQQQLQQELARDNALMEEVDRDVSQVVPDAMEPLSWDNTEGAVGKTGATRQ